MEYPKIANGEKAEPEVRVFFPSFLGIQWVTLGRHDVPFDIHPKGEDKIDNQGRTHSNKRNINKPSSDAGCSDAQSFSDRRTDAE